VRFEASKLPTIAELHAALKVPDSNINHKPVRGRSASVSGAAKSAR
jgi:hypothetical protein